MCVAIRLIEVVSVFQAQRELGMESTLLVTVPVPAESEVDAELLRQVLADSLKRSG